MRASTAIIAILKRELAGYFATPLAYVFISIFLIASGAATFFLGGIFERGQADLQPFFTFHPWLYLLLIPALSMRLWAEEHKSGSIELLLTLPVTVWQAVVGKFLAAWIFCLIALALTFPIWLTVGYLGAPDHGVILWSYIASGLMAGAMLAIGATISALTHNQVIAFVIAGAISFVFLCAGTSVVLDLFQGWAPAVIVDLVRTLSLLTHFQSIVQGVVDGRDIVFFLSLIVFALYLNTLVLDRQKSA
jgi:ABC-2 type transport system permease protein